jgi:hypothetical protein
MVFGIEEGDGNEEKREKMTIGNKPELRRSQDF